MMKRTAFPHAFCAALVALSAATSHAATEARVESLAFDVLLNDQPIGRHEFTIVEDDNRRIVESRAEFDVRVAFIPVFRYRHSNTEQWVDGCLRQIESVTDSNGDSYRVSGEEREGGFAVETIEAERAYNGDCVMTFAYWDRRFLQQDKLLNAQTGELVDVEVEPLAQRSLELNGRTIAVDAFRISSRDGAVDIEVFYASGSETWVALETRLENGRVMRYRPLNQRLAGVGPLVGQ
jgi:hypothetical protein